MIPRHNILKRALDYLNTNLVYLDRLFEAKTIAPTPPPLFIVGVPRSGTTLTYQIITQQLQVGYINAITGNFYGAFNILHRLLKPIVTRPKVTFKSQYGTIKGLLSPSEHANYWFQWFPPDEELGHYTNPNKFIAEDYDSLKSSIGSITTILQKPIVFKCLYLDLTVGTLAQIFPKSKFIFVHRDPLMCCQSILLGRLKQRNPKEWWSVKPPHYKDMLSLPLWKQVTRQVFHTEKIISRDLKRYASGRYLELEYEDICLQPRKIINDIATWLKPLGYKTYHDMRIPQQFSISQDISLSETTVSQIRKNLDLLRKQELP